LAGFDHAIKTAAMEGATKREVLFILKEAAKRL
jgi:hypothetical protein